MKLLIAIKSCERDIQNGNNQAVRDTWAKHFSIDGVNVRFFVGHGSNQLRDDEVRVDAPDDYNGLPWKTRGICAWATANEYDFAFLCDTDTFVLPTLLRVGFENWDYCGYYHDRNIAGRKFDTYKDDRGIVLTDGHWWASGGVGYFLSRRAMSAVGAAVPTHWAEDLWVGQVIGEFVQKQEMTTSALEAFNGVISWHYCSQGNRRKFDKSWLHQAFKNGGPVSW